MYFRLQCFVCGLRLETVEDSQFRFTVNSPPVAVSLRNPDASESSTGVECIAISEAERRTNERVLAAFESMSKGLIPADSIGLDKGSWGGYLNEDGTLNHKTRLPLPTELLPDYLQTYINDIRTQLYGAVRKVVETTRWRLAVLGPPDPITSRWRDAEWSLDGESWFALPASMSIVIRGTPKVRIDDEASDAFRTLVERDTEPTGHARFQEAWELREKHLTSSLLTGIAALELGYKEFAMELDPGTDWVHAPSPPVVDLLTAFLPTVTARADINGKVIPPPEPILASLRKGVSLRNRVAHSPKAATLKAKTVEEVLLAVQDVLWLLDYYRGHRWAWMHIRQATKTQLAPDGLSV